MNGYHGTGVQNHVVEVSKKGQEQFKLKDVTGERYVVKRNQPKNKNATIGFAQVCARIYDHVFIVLSNQMKSYYRQYLLKNSFLLIGDCF